MLSTALILTSSYDVYKVCSKFKFKIIVYSIKSTKLQMYLVYINVHYFIEFIQAWICYNVSITYYEKDGGGILLCTWNYCFIGRTTS